MSIEQSRSSVEAVAQAYGYPRDAQVLNYLDQKGRKLKNALKTENWGGLKILDVACGNAAPEDPQTAVERRFQYSTMERRQAEEAELLHQLGKKLRQPWICRLLAAEGATVTGVDWKYPRYESSNGELVGCTEEGWTFVQRDLLKPNALDPRTFATHDFDVVLCKDFVGPDAIAAPELMTLRDNSQKAYKRVEEDLLVQIARTIKPNGQFFWNEELYRPKGQRFLRVR